MAQRPGYGRLATARDALNAAYNALTLERGDAVAPAADVTLARGYVDEARSALTALGGDDDARAAAHAALAHLEHARAELEAGAVAAPRVARVLDELGAAMDELERALAAVGWE